MALRKLGDKLRRRWRQSRYRVEVARHTRSLYGHLPSQLDDTDLVVVCLMRNEAIHVQSFLKHHFQLGARAIVLMDNGSTDGSLDLARQFDNVVVVRCDCLYATHKYAMKRYLYDRFGQGGWRLIVDIDERFDYPYSNQLPLARFLEFLNASQYSAVSAQMLDLFSKGAPSSWPTEGAALEEACRFYDISGVESLSIPVHGSNTVSNDQIQVLCGGIRRTALGVTQRLTLTKHPLLCPQRGALPSPNSAHYCRHAKIADISCLLKHYKFHGGFANLCRTNVDRGSHFNGSVEYRQCLQTLESDPDVDLVGPTAKVYGGPEKLVDEGFLVVSDAYRAFTTPYHPRRFPRVA